MGATTSIAWTDATWNCLRGCSKVSEGCKNCYAMSVAYRFSGPGLPYEGLAKLVNGKPAWTNRVRFIPEHLEDPLRWRKPRRIFVNSMSDVFHPDVTNKMLHEIFHVMALASWHQFQVLTKRPERMRAYCQEFRSGRDVLPNVWLGTSVEDQAAADERIPYLLSTPAAVRFLSCEPLLGRLDIDRWLWPQRWLDSPVEGEVEWGYPRPTKDLHWVIGGGESGRYARPFQVDWARLLRDQCLSAGIPFFWKQNGGRTSASGGCLLDGQEYKQFPMQEAS